MLKLHLISLQHMRFKMTPSNEGLRKVLAVSLLFLWLLPGHRYCVNGARGGKGKLRIGWKKAVCNEKSCKVSTCDVGQICEKISHPERDYDCYECKDCPDVRTYAEQVKPGGVFQLQEECLHVRVECTACRECVSQHVNTALASNPSVGESIIGSSTAFMADPIVFLFFSAFLLCTMINLFVLGIIIIHLQKLKRIRER